MPILQIFRVMAVQRLKKARFPKTSKKRAFFGHNSKNPQDRHKKLYIFEISVKFCVDWCVVWLSLKKSKIWLIFAGTPDPPVPLTYFGIILWLGLLTFFINSKTELKCPRRIVHRSLSKMSNFTFSQRATFSCLR